MQRDAFGQGLGADTRRVKALNNTQGVGDICHLGAQLVGNVGQCGGEVARFINMPDDVRRDNQFRAGQRRSRLRQQMVLQRDIGHSKAIKIGAIVVETA